MDKEIEMTNEMKNMKYEELKGCLEKKYDKLNEIQTKRMKIKKEMNVSTQLTNELK